MRSPWKTTVHLTPDEIRIRTTTPDEREILTARLPRARHPRALLTLLEGLALWSGRPLTSAISVDERVPVSSGEDPLGLCLWPTDDLFLDVHLVEPERRHDPSRTDRDRATAEARS